MKFYITTPIYYANAEPHIGSAYPTLAADVLARFHRLRGDETWFLTGLDEHGAKVADTAAAAGLAPQEFCDRIAAKFQFAWDELDISNDDFIRTTSEKHKAGVKKLLLKLKDVDAIYEGKYEGLYCKGCEAFVTEKELAGGECPIHKTKPELIEEKNYFFNLKKYLPQLEQLIDRDEIKILPASKKNEVLGLFKQELSDFSISRSSLKWGIAIPWDENQVAYVWADALSNYITALGYGSDDQSRFDKFWPADVHIVGKDIIKFHCIFWPAMLLAAGLPLPKCVYAHGFFTVDGQKMGKSLGNVIDPFNLTKEFGVDATRYLLLNQFPFGQDGDIKASQFVIQYNSDLANGIGNFASRVATMAEKYFAGAVPARSSELKSSVEEIWREYEQALLDLRVDGALLAVRKLNELGDGYVEQNKPWELAKTDPVRLAEVIYNLLEVLRHLSLMLWPIMPSTAEKIFSALGQADFQSQKIEALQVWALLEPGAKINKAGILFPRIQ
ncbi:MAG: methionine--tRNA ligase [Patescibacteria group bacterium]